MANNDYWLLPKRSQRIPRYDKPASTKPWEIYPTMNKAIIIGRLGKDPEMKQSQGGKAICNFSVATSESWKDQNGQAQENTEWHRIVCFGKTAESCGKYLHKGKEVSIEGRIQTRSWDDPSGQKRYITEIIADQVKFLGAPRREDQPNEESAGY